MENKKVEELGTKIISVLKERGYSDSEIESILLTTLKSVISEIEEKQNITNEFENLLGKKLFNNLFEEED